MDEAAAIAFNRFGLGGRAGETPPNDPRGWLRAQLAVPDPTPTDGRLTTAQGLDISQTHEQALHAAKRAGAVNPDLVVHNTVADAFHHEVQEHLTDALVAEAPFRERLVWFWANHFTVAAKRPQISTTVGAYIREAIRPHVTGNFRDMLLAVMRHPAMQFYLDNAVSFGPDSPLGQRRERGLNENLARECLELHTVTPASGYTQADVTSFARVLTGWTVKLDQPPRGFVFRPAQHEPGTKTVLGRTWPEGEQGGVALLGWLADHPATRHHLAVKLARHFTADEPASSDVAALEAALNDSGGDLGAVSRALVDLPGAWRPLTKLRSPQDYVIAALRGAGVGPDDAGNLAGILTGLGQPPFRPSFPIGWPDRAADWAGPEAVLDRVDWAYQLGARLQIDPTNLAATTLGPLLPPATRNQIAGAGNRQEAITLLLASPQFQRR